MFSDTSLIAELQSFTAGDRRETLIRLPEAKRIVEDTAMSDAGRDTALWSLTYAEKRYSGGIIGEIANQDESPRVRLSAAWALMKLGNITALQRSAETENDGNLRAWKLHFAAELQDSAEPFDFRPIRVLENAPFYFTMPLEVEGVVEFRDKEGAWHSYVTGPLSNERLIGNLTPAINADTFQTALVLQKRIKNIRNSGSDHIEGYSLRGISRQIAENVFRHQYEAISQHTVYPSGVVGDESEGIIEKGTASLARVADTHLSTKETVPFPYPHSVRGSFKGFVYMNPVILDDPKKSPDGLLQIISPVDDKAGHLVNGIFHGTFRGIPQDLDGDGKVELNGVHMFVDKNGTVLERHPKSGESGASGKRQPEYDDLRKEVERLRSRIDELEGKKKG